MKKEPEFITVHSWSEFSLVYRGLPVGKSELIIRVMRDGKLRDLAVTRKKEP